MYQRFMLFAVVIVVATGFMVPTDIVSAKYGYEHSWEGKYEERMEKYKQRRERMEQRITRTQERLCARLERLEDRFNVAVTKPDFCDEIPAPEPEPEAPTLDFAAQPTAIIEGETSTLSWSSSDTTACDALGAWSGTKPVSGDEDVSPSVGEHGYGLVCEGEGGSVTEYATVTVEALPPTPLPVVNFSADLYDVVEGATSTLSWATEYAEVCIASGAPDWVGAMATTSGAVEVTVTATTTYTFACGNETGTTTMEVEIRVIPEAEEPEPEPAGSVLITEVLFDPGPSGEQGTDAHNEWVEVYNGTDSTIDLLGWFLSDGNATDTIATESLMLPAGEYLVVTRSTTTDLYWSYGEGAVVVYLESPLGSAGLRNGGEAVLLSDDSDVLVDAVSWGDNTVAFDPSVAPTGVTEGQSIMRTASDVDTDGASDWEVADVPTPGDGSVSSS